MLSCPQGDVGPQGPVGQDGESGQSGVPGFSVRMIVSMHNHSTIMVL